MTLSPWPILRRRTLTKNRIFSLMAHDCRSPRDGRQHEFYVLDSPDWVNVVPLTSDGEVLFVRQYRHGRKEMTLEIPGGMVDPEDADPAEAARRELLEETGTYAATIRYLGSIAPNPAILSNLCHSYVATDLEHRGPLHLDSTEEIELERHPLVEVPGLIAKGAITHALVVVAFTYLLGLGTSAMGSETR